MSEDIDFDKEEKDAEQVMGPDDFKGSTWIQNPSVGESITLTIKKVVNNPNTTGKNKKTNQTFDIGLKKKNGKVQRYDVHAEEGIYTINSWDVWFKLFSNDGILMKYSKEHNNTFVDAVVKITRNFDGSLAFPGTKVEDVAKLQDISVEEAQKKIDEAVKAMKDKKLYTVELV